MKTDHSRKPQSRKSPSRAHSTVHSILTQNVLNTAIDYVRDNRFAPMLDLGFTHRQLGRLSEMQGHQLSRLVNRHGTFMKIEIDTDVLNRYLDVVDTQSNEDRIIDELIINDAPHSMIHFLTAMSSNEHYHRAALLDAKRSGPGRRKILSDDEIQTIWTTWATVNTDERDLPRCFLKMAHETPYALFDIWTVMEPKFNKKPEKQKRKFKLVGA